MRIIYLLLSIIIASSVSADGAINYQYKAGGISFSYDNVSIDENSSRDSPLAVVFVAGTRPFAVSIIFRAEKGSDTLSEFVQKERENQKKGGYEKETTITKVDKNNISAYEIVRKSKHMNIRWYIFKSIKNDNLYSFWLAENSGLKKENAQAIRSFETMKSTLVLSK